MFSSYNENYQLLIKDWEGVLKINLLRKVFKVAKDRDCPEKILCNKISINVDARTHTQWKNRNQTTPKGNEDENTTRRAPEAIASSILMYY